MEAINFLTNYITWLLIIIPSGAAAMVTYLAIKKALASNASVIDDCNTKIFNTIKGAIIGMSISGLVTLIKKFYL